MLHNHGKAEVAVMAGLGWREKCDGLPKGKLGNLKSKETHSEKKKYHLTATLNFLTALHKKIT